MMTTEDFSDCLYEFLCNDPDEIDDDITSLPPKKMFDWTNDFLDVKCTDPFCTKIHPKDNEYYVPE
jgi:hypothetical protein